MKQRMNVQTIAEVLVNELGKIEKQTDKLQDASRRIDQAIKQLANSEIKVDTSELTRIEKSITNTYKDTVHLPRWFAKASLYTLITCIILTIISCTLAGYYYNKLQDTTERENYWYEQYQILKQNRNNKK